LRSSRDGYFQSRRAFLGASLPAGWVGAFVAAAVLVAMLAAWFNDGFLNADEHYQILEFAQYKLGLQSPAALAWEFAEHMRPALQPWLAALAIRAHHQLGVISPFTIAWSLRVLSAVLGLWVSLELCARVLPRVSSRWARQAALFLSFFLWIVPTAHARFSSENWGGLWFAAGLCLALDAADERSRQRRHSLVLGVATGVVWGIAFYCRFQMAIAIAGAMAYLAFIHRRPALCAAITSGFVAACALNEGLDRWLYGVWSFAPLNYLWMNLVLGKAAAFGTAPWWMVMVYIATVLIPPFSLAVLVILAIGSWYGRRHLVTWSVVPFLVVHAVLARKDARFLIPMLYLLGPWFAVSVDALPPKFAARLDRWRHLKVARVAVAAFCAADLAVLAVAVTLPGNDRIRLARWQWDHSHQHPVTIFELNQRHEALPENVTNSFYASDLVMKPFVAGSVIEAAQTKPVFLYYEGPEPSAAKALDCRPVVRSYPLWLTQLSLVVRTIHVTSASICRVYRSLT
jgi:phosphatidylinositol glycan class B